MTDRALLLEALTAARDILMRRFRTELSPELKPDLSVVTIADKEAEAAIINILAQSGYTIIAEETGVHEHKTSKVWVVDPLDGTSNFSRGIPIFGVAIALLDDGLPILAGIAHDGELFLAERTKGVTLNGKQIRIPSEEPTRGYISYDMARNQLEDFLVRLVKFSSAINSDKRKFGCCTFGFTRAATGQADAYIAHGQPAWDLAAGVLIAQEAGCVVTTWRGEEWRLGADSVLAARASLHAKLLPYLQ